MIWKWWFLRRWKKRRYKQWKIIYAEENGRGDRVRTEEIRGKMNLRLSVIGWRVHALGGLDM